MHAMFWRSVCLSFFCFGETARSPACVIDRDAITSVTYMLSIPTWLGARVGSVGRPAADPGGGGRPLKVRDPSDPDLPDALHGPIGGPRDTGSGPRRSTPSSVNCAVGTICRRALRLHNRVCARFARSPPA
jgi:hypothetical protein